MTITMNFVGHMLSVTTNQLCLCGVKAASDSTLTMAMAVF